MARRPPRLPMVLGLAVLTVAAHLCLAMAHAITHPLADWWLLLLLGIAPFLPLALILRGRPRHGAVLLALLMLVAAFHTLYLHHLDGRDTPPTVFYAGVVQLLLGFELQGLVAGVVLAFKPEVPRDVALAS